MNRKVKMPFYKLKVKYKAIEKGIVVIEVQNITHQSNVLAVAQ